MNQQKTDAFAERLFNDVNSALSCLNLYLGYRLGLLAAVHTAGPVTPTDLAEQTGYNERYVHEWLYCLAAGGYLDYDSTTGRFSLPPEYAAVLVERGSPSYFAPFMCFVPSLAGVLDPLMEAFRTGGGVPYEAYGSDTREAVAEGNRPMFVHDYVDKWIPAMPDIQARLEEGGQVVDIGCGRGWSSISLAGGFPNARVDAVDIDAASIAEARLHAAQAGVADRITFHSVAAEEAPLHGPYDLVTAFECIHDMPYPVQVLRRMRELAAPNGAVLIADEAVGDSLEENQNAIGHFMYNFSVLHCLPQAMVFPNAAGTGTVMGPVTLRNYAQEAGFSRVDVLPIENPFWRFYRLTP